MLIKFKVVRPERAVFVIKFLILSYFRVGQGYGYGYGCRAAAAVTAAVTVWLWSELEFALC